MYRYMDMDQVIEEALQWQRQSLHTRKHKFREERTRNIMDTPIITLYYRESDPMKRKMFLDQSIAAGEEEEANAIRKELWEIRYGGKSEVPDTPADGYLALWMALEFNKNASSRLFGAKSARQGNCEKSSENEDHRVPG